MQYKSKIFHLLIDFIFYAHFFQKLFTQLQINTPLYIRLAKSNIPATYKIISSASPFNSRLTRSNTITATSIKNINKSIL